MINTYEVSNLDQFKECHVDAQNDAGEKTPLLKILEWINDDFYHCDLINDPSDDAFDFDQIKDSIYLK